MSDPLLDLPLALTRWFRVAGVVIGAAVATFGFWGRRTGLLDYRPGGTAFGENVLPILSIGLAVAVAIAFRWEIIGGALAAFLGAGLAVFAANQLVPWHAAAMVAGFAIPALLWLAVDLADLPPQRALVGVAVSAVLAIAGGVVAQATYSGIWGPTHPDSEVVELPDSPVRWAWSGAVSHTGAEIRMLPDNPGSDVRLELSTDEAFNAVRTLVPDDTYGSVVGFKLESLAPDSDYHYRFVVDGEVDSVRTGRFATFPVGPASFTIAVGSCARVGSNGAVFDAIRANDPLVYLAVGDLHYGDNNRDDIERFREVMDLTLAQPAQSALYRSVPVAYVWDDHDYAGNDSGGDARSRASAMSAYREYVPSYTLAGADSAVYQSFTVGRVRIIMTDARAARDLDPFPGSDQMSMLGTEQRKWLENELVTAAADHALVIWVNPVPWVAEAVDGADHWGGYSAERRHLADLIASNDIDNLLMVSGDAHMIAIDDGTNTDYSSSGGAGFPLIHAAPLDRPGGIKGGPYSHGAIAEGGQFATIEIDDDGERVEVELTGRDWQNRERLSYRFLAASRPG